jgi:hypothetical protein
MFFPIRNDFVRWPAAAAAAAHAHAADPTMRLGRAPRWGISAARNEEIC